MHIFDGCKGKDGKRKQAQQGCEGLCIWCFRNKCPDKYNKMMQEKKKPRCPACEKDSHKVPILTLAFATLVLVFANGVLRRQPQFR